MHGRLQELWLYRVKFPSDKLHSKSNETSLFFSISAILSVEWSLTEGLKKTKENFTFSSKRCRGRLREVVPYQRFFILWFWLGKFWYFLENWSLRRDGRNNCNICFVKEQELFGRQCYQCFKSNIDLSSPYLNKLLGPF